MTYYELAKSMVDYCVKAIERKRKTLKLCEEIFNRKREYEFLEMRAGLADDWNDYLFCKKSLINEIRLLRQWSAYL